MTDLRSPLVWPSGWPRTPAHERRVGRFSGTTTKAVRRTENNGAEVVAYLKNKRPVSLEEASKRIYAELVTMGVDDPILSTDVPVRRDGMPYSTAREPADPGAAVYFKRWGKPFSFALDTYNRVADNIAGLAAYFNAMRTMERHGVGKAEQLFQGYLALPPRPSDHRSWRSVLGFGPADSPNAAAVEAAFHRLALVHHPDLSGSHDKMAELSAARIEARKEIGS